MPDFIHILCIHIICNLHVHMFSSILKKETVLPSSHGDLSELVAAQEPSWFHKAYNRHEFSRKARPPPGEMFQIIFQRQNMRLHTHDKLAQRDLPVVCIVAVLFLSVLSLYDIHKVVQMCTHVRGERSMLSSD